ncbi:MAG TPA: KUP/HAK/KT family potassium transporter [Candidatus Acidoferrales bacterium]|nr:KUP/HAK/KT family potassium transporter [Candidatus Acidoferrales bacterium]
MSVSDGLPTVAHDDSGSRPRFKPGLAIAALGVVFGDIGTSPLYTIRTCFTTANVQPTLENVLGILSILLWALAFVVCVKYVGNLMRVDHDGEGGILALLALAPPPVYRLPVRVTWLTIVVVVGAAMLFGDGMITPAISVVSAVEGLGVATNAAQPFIVPISVAILIGLFLIQSRGTERVGHMFGPIMAVWFLAIGVAGLAGIVRAPHVLAALDPRHALYFVTHHGIFGFLVFGGIVLAMTGVEALYADMSHFGRAPIAIAWYVLVFPALLLSYLGQGAVLLADPGTFASPFFALIPGAMLIPMVILATLATVIASQALISGAFTLTEQAINLNLWPRMTVLHTSTQQRGQVYVPVVNVALGIACVALVVTFRSSDKLAAAYGLAVSGTMLATSIAFYEVITNVLKWKKIVAVPLVASFVLIDGTFFLSGLPKIPQGAWIPLLMSVVFVATALTWLQGRSCIARALLETQVPLEQYVGKMRPAREHPRATMIFLTGDQHGVPFVGGHHQWIRARADEERVVLLTLLRAAGPYVDATQRVVIKQAAERLWLVTAQFGYMERPSIGPIVAACGAQRLHLDTEETSFFYADPRLTRAPKEPLPTWQRRYFEFLARNAHPLPDDLGIRPEWLVEIGVVVAV